MSGPMSGPIMRGAVYLLNQIKQKKHLPPKGGHDTVVFCLDYATDDYILPQSYDVYRDDIKRQLIKLLEGCGFRVHEREGANLCIYYDPPTDS